MPLSHKLEMHPAEDVTSVCVYWYPCPTQTACLNTIPENDAFTQLKAALQTIQQDRIIIKINAFILSML